MTKPIKAADWVVKLITQGTLPQKHVDVGGINPFLGDGHRNNDLTALAGFGVRKYGFGPE